MATGVKTAAFVALVRVLTEAFPAFTDLWQPIIAVLAVLSMVVGNVVALAQTSLKRLLAYSSIAHAGYLLVGVWTATDLGRAAVLLYLIAYSITSLAAFGIITAVERVGSRTVMLEDVEGFFRVRPWGALSMGVCLLSLLGFPGTFGFIGKWYLMTAAIDRNQVLLAVIMGLGSLVSLGYYLPVVMAMNMKPERTPDAHRQVLFSRAAKAIVAVAVLPTWCSVCGPRKVVDLARAAAGHMIGTGRPSARCGADERPEAASSAVRRARHRRHRAHAGVRARARPCLRERGLGSLRSRAALAVGRDNRPSGPALAAGSRQGIVDAGGTAVDVGLLPTPALYFAVQALERRRRLSRSPARTIPPSSTASRWCLGGESMHGDDIIALWERSSTAERRQRAGTRPPTARSSSAIATRSWPGIGRSRVRCSVVVDCGNGAGSAHRASQTLRGSAPR